MDALKRDYLVAWERLDAYGITMWMLEYDPATLTFSLPMICDIAGNSSS